MDAKFVPGLAGKHAVGRSRGRSAVVIPATQAPDLTNSSMDWYRLTEGSRNVLNAIITYTSREQLNEEAKTNPDQQKIITLEKQYEEAYDILNKSDNFKSLERMQEILDTYTPLLQSLLHFA